MPAVDVLNFTRPGPRNRLGEAKHGILLPETGLLRPSKVEKFEYYSNPVPDRAGGHRQYKGRHARGEIAVLC